ncbi:MAG: carbohydrate kinase family protein [Candidatus Magasanikbacteria bacterium]|nr:carbohydrate kinase family protein [Candidatus Magasanikbacteria bacterium]
MAILVSGSLAYDYIMNFPDSFKNHILPDQIHILNVCFTVDKLAKSWGGTAGNIAYTLSLLGNEVLIASALGSDSREYLAHLRTKNINTEYILKDSARLTASAYITTDIDDNQVTAFYNGPLDLAASLDFRPLQKSVTLALISPTNKDVMIKHLRESRSLGWTTVFDPGQQLTAFKSEELTACLGQANIVIGNDYEIRLLEKQSGLTTADILKSSDLIITTLGAKGSVISTQDGQIIAIAPCKPNSVDDPTGAGDAYRAGFCAGYEHSLPLKTCGQMGAVAASFAIETYGTQAHTFTKIEFAERYEKTYGEKLGL